MNKTVEIVITIVCVVCACGGLAWGVWKFLCALEKMWDYSNDEDL